LEKGLTENKPWTLCIDADVLPLPELQKLLQEARQLPIGFFEIQGLVFDKLLAAPRAAGNHLYRTYLMERALTLIPSGNSLRPETDMILAMANLGYPSHQSRCKVGLHDYEQSFQDIYAKASLHGHKHRFLMPLVRPLWQMLSRIDDDYRIALLALDDARQQQAKPPSVSRDYRKNEARNAPSRLGLLEKPALVCPTSDQMSAWIATGAWHGEAIAVSNQIASTIELGTFPEDENRLSVIVSKRVFDSKVDAKPPGTTPVVALVCSNVYPHFYLCAETVTGGMETRAALFGRGLAATGRWQVKFVVGDFGQPFQVRHEAIDFHIYQPEYRRAGRNVFPRLRKRRWFPALNLDRRDFFLLWQIPLITAFLAVPAFFFPRFWRRLRPKVVCCFGNNALSAEIIADCRRLGVGTILCLASEEDVSPNYRPGNRTLNNYGMPKWKGHYALTTADCLVVQTESQGKALQQHFGLPSILIRNPVHISPDDPKRWLPRNSREFVLWIGRADDFNKRPMAFIELARRCPDLHFLMIANRTNETIFHALQAACPDNLRIVEHVRPSEIWEYLSLARVFVNTSLYEGFPNTFLQCAVMGVPIVSLEVDPDGFLARHGCGVSAEGDPNNLRQAVLRLWGDAIQAEALAAASHRYVLEQHEVSERVAALEACIAHIAATGPKPRKLPWWGHLSRYSR